MRRLPSSWLALALALVAGCHHGAAPAHRACPTGPVIVGGQDDVAALAGCTAVASLAIRTGMTLDFTPLASLATIRGDLVIGPSIGLEEVKLTGLAEVGGAIRIASNNLMRGVFFPKLAHAGSVAVESNVALATLSLPTLATVDHDVTVSDGNDLELIAASRLTSIGGTLTLANDPELALVELDALAHVAAVAIDRVGKLPADVVATLRALAPAAPEKP